MLVLTNRLFLLLPEDYVQNVDEPAPATTTPFFAATTAQSANAYRVRLLKLGAPRLLFLQ